MEQNLSPFSPRLEMGKASLQSVVVLDASKKVAYLGQVSSKKAAVNAAHKMIQKKVIITEWKVKVRKIMFYLSWFSRIFWVVQK